ncbi:MAG: DnaD domain protein [Chloroflexota bacterium]|nr:DnaD domain protein [Chloroflexota bacterium]
MPLPSSADLFSGFRAASAASFPVYASFITDALPLIDDLGELKVTLYALWAIRQREGSTRYLLLGDFASAGLFPAATADPLIDALDRACARGTLISETMRAEHDLRLFFINDDAGRAAAAQVRVGHTLPLDGDLPVTILPPRPSIYALYEQNIGALTPMIRDELLSAEREYPAGWLEEAMRLAVSGNKRNWRYIRAILDRWEKEGKTHETAPRSAAESERRIARDPSDFIVR